MYREATIIYREATIIYREATGFGIIRSNHFWKNNPYIQGSNRVNDSTLGFTSEE